MMFTVFAGLVFHSNEFSWDSIMGYLNADTNATNEVRALKEGLHFEKFIFKIGKIKIIRLQSSPMILI